MKIKSKDIYYFDLFVYFLVATEIISALGIISGFGLYRGAFIGLYTITVFLLTFDFKLRPASLTIVLFIVYTTFLLLISDNFWESFYLYVRATTALLVFVIAMKIFTYEKFIYLLDHLVNIQIVLIGYIIIAIIIGIGEGAYLDDNFTFGGVNSGTLTYLTIIGPAVIGQLEFKSKFKKLIYIIALSIAFIVILTSVKRTTIAIMAIALIVYIFYSKEKLKFVYSITSIAIIIFLTSFLWFDTFINRFEHRSDALQLSIERFEQEGRTMELRAVIDEITQFNDPKYSLFGRSVYYTVGQYGSNTGVFFGSNRVIHNDLALLLNSTGIIGTLLYIIFLIIILYEFIKKFPSMMYSVELRNIYIMALIVFLASFLQHYNGSYFGNGNRTIMFLIISTIFYIEDSK